MKRKMLVVVGDAARHSFLASLSPEGRKGRARGRRWAISLTSVREFLMAYCACFLAVSLFIA
jgi:hypothetical protein